jgi:hypothetical protein
MQHIRARTGMKLPAGTKGTIASPMEWPYASKLELHESLLGLK